MRMFEEFPDAKEREKQSVSLLYIDTTMEMMPKDGKYCIDCGVELIQREDDKIETFEKRYSTYLELTEPLIDYCSKKDNLYKIYAGGQRDETLHNALEILNKLGE